MEDKDTKLIEKILFIEALHDFPTIQSIPPTIIAPPALYIA